MAQRALLHRSTLTELERYLDPAEFLRVHRSTLVRRSQMLAFRQTLEGGQVLSLKGGQDVVVSERYAPAVKAELRLRSVW
jgi:two-component system LytT family response regulator